MAADLNLRNLDPRFIAKLKSDAALAGKTLREWCIGLLGGKDADIRRAGSDAGSGEKRAGNRATVPVLPKAKSKPKRLHPVQSVRGELAERGDAPAELPRLGPASSSPESCPHGNRNEAYCRYIKGGC